MLLSTSMVSGAGLVDPPASGMMPAAMSAILSDARAALAESCSKRRLRKVLKDISDLAAAELKAEELLECAEWQLFSVPDGL